MITQVRLTPSLWNLIHLIAAAAQLYESNAMFPPCNAASVLGTGMCKYLLCKYLLSTSSHA